MEHRLRINLLSTAIVLGSALVVSVVTSAVVASRAYRSRAEIVTRAEQQLTVKGYARQSTRSDLGVWEIKVIGEGESLRDAFETLEVGVDRIHQFLVERGFTSEEIALEAIKTNTHYLRDDAGAATRDVAGYTLERRLVVTSAQVEQISAAASEVTQLIRDNVPVRSFAPAYTFSKVGDLKVDLLGAAAADARRRAENIAAKSGCAVAAVRNARQGVIQITRPNSTDVASYGIYDTSTIAKDISVVVTVTFGIVPLY